MGPDILALMIPISAIVLGIGSGIVKNILRSQERRLEMRLQLQQGANQQVVDQLAAMRVEVAAVRDTTTQHALSLQQSMDRLEQRVTFLETQRIQTMAGATVDDQRLSRL